MPIFFQQQLDTHTQLGIWKIEEEEAFFLQKVPLHRNITHPHKRLQHLAGRFLLQHLYPDFPISLIQIADTRKPFLPNESVHFSLSHCGDYAAAIVSDKLQVGIDIEVPSEKVVRIMPKFMHESELSLIGMHPEQQATVLWSAKEAVFKWWGRGGVDFSEMIQLSGQNENATGTFDTLWNHPEGRASLKVFYQKWEELVLSWVTSDPFQPAFSLRNEIDSEDEKGPSFPT